MLAERFVTTSGRLVEKKDRPFHTGRKLCESQSTELVLEQRYPRVLFSLRFQATKLRFNTYCKPVKIKGRCRIGSRMHVIETKAAKGLITLQIRFQHTSH